MTALPEDSWLLNLRPQYEPVTAEDYEALPEDIARTIEIVGGYVVFCESPTPDHQMALRRLAELLERHARAAMDRGHECLTVNVDVDVRLRDLPLHFRRPDVVMYKCLDRKRGERLRAEHALLVVEVVCPGTEPQDTVDKFGEYAKAGIPNYWIVRLDDVGVSVIEQYQLDRAAMLYKHVRTHMKAEDWVPMVGTPIPIEIDWAALEF
jgi:Uma2 family endonuclease